MNTKWIIAGVLLLILLGGGTVIYNQTRGLRNNNPGNIRKSGTKWQGEIPGDDPDFVTFITPELGIRALGVLIRNYQRLYKLSTIRDIISRYAPPSENDTESYINAVSRDMNIDADQDISLESPAILSGFVQAIIRHENGLQPYNVATIDKGISLA